MGDGLLFEFVKTAWRAYGEDLLRWGIKIFEKKKILIVGDGGVGKTTLAELLAANMSMLSVRPEYEESINTEIYSVKSLSAKAEVHVVAGQKHRRASTWKETLNLVEDGSMDGVIVANAYGYHTIGGAMGLKGEPTYRRLEKDGKQEEFLAEHLREMRENEIEVLRYIAPFLKARDRMLWVLSAITKEDLWFDEHGEVRDHYAQGEYNAIMEEIGEVLGAGRFRHELATISLVLQDFRTGRNELLKRRCQGYGQAEQVKSMASFIEVLSGLC